MKRMSFNDPGHAHFLTFSCFHRQQLLTDEFARSCLRDAICVARDRHKFALWAYVLMPEHVHLLIHPLEEEYKMGMILRDIKEFPSRRVIQRWREVAPRKLTLLEARHGQRTVHRFWLAGGGYDRNLISGESVRNAIAYIEWNPVRRRLVDGPTDWLWSSAQARSGVTKVPLGIDEIDVSIV